MQKIIELINDPKTVLTGSEKFLKNVTYADYKVEFTYDGKKCKFEVVLCAKDMIEFEKVLEKKRESQRVVEYIDGVKALPLYLAGSVLKRGSTIIKYKNNKHLIKQTLHLDGPKAYLLVQNDVPDFTKNGWEVIGNG